MPSTATRSWFFAALIWALGSPLLAAPPNPVEPVVSVTTGRRQLFLDDTGLADRQGLTRVFHRPEKRGAVLRSPDPKKAIQTRTAPVWDESRGKFLLWVLSIDQPLWESSDGLHWQPLPNPDRRIDMAVIDPRDPDPGRRFKAPLLNDGFATSPDGAHWTRLEIPKITSSDEGNFSYHPDEGLFIHTVKRGGPNGRAVALATSRDFVNWNDLGVVFHADERDQELGRQNIEARLADATLQPLRYSNPQAWRVDVYNMGVFWYEGLYLGTPAMFHATGNVPNYPNTDGFHLIQLVVSRDLQTWIRLADRQTFIGPSRIDSGAYDLTQLIGPSAPVIREDELWFYYTGLKYRSTFDYRGQYPTGEAIPVPGRDRDVGGICLAVLRRDGFASLEAGDEPGTATTRQFSLPSATLRINAQVREGDLTAELLTANGDVLARSKPLTGDQPRGRMEWEDQKPAVQVGTPVALRLTVRKGNLYSYWFE